MGDSAAGYRGVVVVFVSGDRRLAWPALPGAASCDLDLVDRLLWLHLLARRAGWDVVLEDVDEELRGLLELAGVADLLVVADDLSDRRVSGDARHDRRAQFHGPADGAQPVV